MEQEDITLELLVRNGNRSAVAQYLGLNGGEEMYANEKIAETGIYSAIRRMGDEDSQVGIDSEEVCEFLGQEHITKYLDKISDVKILGKIVDALQAGTEVDMETYARITPFDILGMDAVSSAVKRNMGSPSIRNKVTRLVKEGYSLVFCSHNMDADEVNRYFPLIDKFRDLIDPEEVVKSSIRDLLDYGDKDLEAQTKYKRDFVYAALDKLTQLGNRETVSKLAYESFEDSTFQFLVSEGKIDAHIPPQDEKGSGNKTLDKLLRQYEESYSWRGDRMGFEKVVKDKHKPYIAQIMGEWFVKGKEEHMLALAKNKENLYDLDVAKKSISEGIAQVSQYHNWDRLNWAIDNLPEDLIDRDNPEISGFIMAYDLSKKAEEEE